VVRGAPFNFDNENEPVQDFVSVCIRASSYYDCLTRSYFGVKIDNSLGRMGDIMTGVADMAAKKTRLRMVSVWLRRVMH